MWGANAHLDLLRRQADQNLLILCPNTHMLEFGTMHCLNSPQLRSLINGHHLLKTTGPSLGIKNSPSVSLTVAVPNDTMDMV